MYFTMTVVSEGPHRELETSEHCELGKARL